MTVTNVELVIRMLVVWSMVFMLGPSAVITHASDEHRLEQATKAARPLYQADPVADFTGSPTVGVAPLSVSFINNSTDAVSYQWSYGDGTVSHTTEITHSHVYTQAGSYTVVLQATNDVSVTDTLTQTAYVTVSAPPPVAYFEGNPTSGDEPLTVTFVNSSTNASSYQWSYGDGTSSTIDSITHTHTYTQSGQYSVELMASNGVLSATYSRPNYITVNTLTAPQAKFGAGPQSGIEPLTVTFVNSSTNASNYSWDFGDGQSLVTNILSPISHTYSTAGSYTVTLSASNGTLTDTLTQSELINVNIPNQPPTSGFSATPIQGHLPLTITLSNTSNNASQYLWDFGNGQISSEVNPTTVYTQAGIYSITLQASDGTITDTSQNIITTTEAISVVAEGSAWQYFKGTTAPAADWTTIPFDDSGWSNGQGGFGTQSGNTVLSDMVGSYSSLFTRHILEISDPTAVYGMVLGMRYEDGFIAYLNGTPILTQNVSSGSYTVTASSTEIVTQTVTFDLSEHLDLLQFGTNVLAIQGHNDDLNDTNFALSAELMLALIGMPLLDLTITSSTPDEVGQVTTLEAIVASGSGVSYEWEFGDGTNQQVPFSPGQLNSTLDHTYPATGTYTVVVTASNAVSELVTTELVTVTAPVGLIITKDGPVIAEAGAPITYTLTITNYGGMTVNNLIISDTLPSETNYVSGGTLTGEVVVWSVPSLDAGNQASVTFVVTATETITNSQYEVSADGGVMSVGVEAVVTEISDVAADPVVADFSATSLAGPTPLSVTFLNQSSNATSYEWDFGDGTTSTIISPTHTYTQAGSYTVILQASDGVVTDTLTRSNYVTPFNFGNPIANFTASPQSGDVPLAVTFVNSSTNATGYAWDFGDGNSSMVTSPVHTYSTPGIYTVTLQAGNGIVTDTLSLSHYITATELLLAVFDPFPPNVKVGQTVLFLNNSTGTTAYEWDFGDGITTTLPSPTHTYSTAGIYTVTLTASNDSASVSTTEVMAVTETPQALFRGNPQNGDAPLTVTFVNSSTHATSYEWDFGDGSRSMATSPVHTYTASGLYTVTLHAGDSSLTDTLTLPSYITVTEAVVAAFNPFPPSAQTGQTILFLNNSTGATDYEWDFGETVLGQPITTTIPSPTHTYSAVGVYTVTLLAQNGERSDTATAALTILAAPPPVMYFTVNSDGPHTFGSLSGVQNEDIVSYDGSDFTGVFDGSAFGITPSIDAIHVVDEDTILFSLRAAATLPGNLAVDDWDIVQYESPNTFTLYFDGEDVGLNSSGEDIDALTVLEDGRILLSTSGNPGTDVISDARDEDVLVFTPTSLGETTAGSWTLYFDSGDVELTTYNEGINGFHLEETDQVYFSTQGTFDVTNLTGDNEDVAQCTLVTSGTTTSCTYETTLYFDGDQIDADLAALYIEGLSFAPVAVADEVISGLTLTSDSPTPLAATTTFSITLSTGTNVSYLWNFGDGSPETSSGSTASHNYSTVGTYTVVVTASNSVNDQVDTTTVIVQDVPPVANFTTSSPDILGEVTSFTNNSTGSNLSYAWSFGDGTTSDLENPTHTYITTGTFTVVFTATNGLGSATYSETVLIEAPIVEPLLYFSVSEGGSYTFGNLSGVQNEDIVSYDGSDFSIVLDGSDLGIDPSIDALHIVDENTILFSLRAADTLSNGLAVDDWDIVQLEATSLGETTAGTLSLYLDGEDVGLDSSDEDIDAITVLPDSRVLISTGGNPAVVTDARDEDVLAFTPTTLGATTAGSWAMYLDSSDLELTVSNEGIDGVHLTADDQLYLSTVGSFAVTGLSGEGPDIAECALVSSGNTTACTFASTLYFDADSVDNTFATVSIEAFSLVQPAAPALPISGLTVSSGSPVPLGQSVPLTATVAAGNDISYTWDFGDASGLTTSNNYLLHTYGVTGTYTVIVTATNSVNSQVATTTVIVQDAPPVASFTTSSPDVLGNITSFTNTSTGSNLNYSWHFGDGTIVTTESPTYTYPATGTYTVYLTATNSLGSDIYSDTVEIIDTPPTLMGYWTLDEHDANRVDGSGNGNDLVQSGSIVSATGQIDHAVDLEATNNDYLSIDHTTQTGLDVNGSLTLVGWARLESSPSGDHYVLASKYEWGTAPGNRGYRLTVNDGDYLTFVVSPDGDYTPANNELVVTSTTVSIGTWHHIAAVFDADYKKMLLYQDGTLVASRDIDHSTIFTSTAPFILGANEQNGNVVQHFDGQLDEWRVYAEVLEQPQIQALRNVIYEPISGLSVSSDSPVSLGQSMTLTATVSTGSDVDYSWHFSDGTLVTTQDNVISHTFEMAVGYTVVITAANPLNSESTTIGAVVIDTPPVASFTTSSPDGLGQTTVFSNTSIGTSLSYTWDFGDGSSPVSVPHPTHTYALIGTYVVTLSVSNNQGSDLLTQTVVIQEHPDELVAYWNFNENETLGVGYGHSLSNTVNTNYSAGQLVGALDLERDLQQYVYVDETEGGIGLLSASPQQSLNITGSLTLVGWVNAERTHTGRMMFASKYRYGGGNGRAYRFGLNEDQTLHFVVSPDNTYNDDYLLDGTTPLTTNGTQWHHVAAVFDAEQKELRVYLDGVLDATPKDVSYSTIHESAEPFRLGADSENGTLANLFDGRLDEWRVYNTVLLDSEIANLASEAPSAASSVIRYVDQATGSDNSNCQNPATPCQTLQYAVDWANPNDEIRVAAGTYTGVTSINGTLQILYLNKAVTLRGGYTTADWSTPDPINNPTILDAQDEGRVLYITGADTTAHIEGFEIIDGNASTTLTNDGGFILLGVGGGVYIDGSPVTLENNKIYSNYAIQAGAGIYAKNSNPVIRGNSITNNSMFRGEGAGVYLVNSNGLIEQNTIADNEASGLGGGGIFILDGSPLLTDNVIRNNVATPNNPTFTGSNGGGGIYLANSQATVDTNVIEGNVTASGGLGGGLYLGNSDAQVTGNLFISNTMFIPNDGSGSAVGIFDGSDPTFANNILLHNESGQGGAIYVKNASPELIHTTIIGQIGDGGNGIIVDTPDTGQNSQLTLVNTILVSHTRGISVATGSSAILKGTLWGSPPWNNIADIGGLGDLQTSDNHWGAPDFLDPINRDYRLSATSAAINSGVESSVSTDRDGAPRPIGSSPDAGAHEFQAIVVNEGIRYVASNGVDNGICTDSNNPCATVQYALDWAVAGDEVRVASGVYTDVINRLEQHQVAFIEKSITLRGGYTDTNWLLSDPINNETTLAPAGDDGRGIYITGNITPTVEGFHITSGDDDHSGGGVFVEDASVTLQNNWIHHNSTNLDGAGIYLIDSPSHILNNVIYENQTIVGSGAGVAVINSDATLTNNHIHGNSANTHGGGIYLDDSAAQLISNTIELNNKLIGYGSGLYANNSPLALQDSVVRDNQAYIDNSQDVNVLNNYFIEDGILLLDQSQATLINNFIVDNGSLPSGSLYIDNSTAHLLQTTIARNGTGPNQGGASTGGTGIGVVQGSTVLMTNTILVSQTVGLEVSVDSTVHLNSTLWGSDQWANETDWTGPVTTENDVSGLPEFVDPDDGDYRLASTSPAINAGVDNGVSFDIDGEARPFGTGYDLGADEFFLDIEADWQLIPTTSAPPIINESALAYDSDQDRIVLFGGNADGWRYEKDTWEFNKVTATWTPITVSQSPPSRYGMEMAYTSAPIAGSSSGGVILFGGSDENDTALNQTWHYDGSTWAEVTISGSVPPSRTHHALTVAPSSGTVYLFGGNDEGVYHNDLWSYQAGVWTSVAVSGNNPISRTLTALTYDPDHNRLLLFGGRTVTGTLLADLWAFDLSGSNTWQLLDDGGGGGGPPPRIGHSLTYHPETSSAVLVGGDPAGQTWLWLGSGWALAPTTTIPPQAYHGATNGDGAVILFSRGEVWSYE